MQKLLLPTTQGRKITYYGLVPPWHYQQLFKWQVTHGRQGAELLNHPLLSSNPVSSKAKQIFHALLQKRLTTAEQPQHHLVFNKSAERLNRTLFCQSALMRTTFQELSVVQTGTWLRFSVCPPGVNPDATRGCRKEACSWEKTRCSVMLVMLCAQSCYTALVKTLPGKL